MVVIENHNRIGGLCSAVNDALAGNEAASAVESVPMFRRYCEVDIRDCLWKVRSQTAAENIAKAHKALNRE